MPAPQAILCHLCNGKFFKRSYPIHLKQCEKKWKLTHSRCEKCGTVIANADWSDHLQICKRIRGQRVGSSKCTDPVEPPKAHGETMPSAIATRNKGVTECEECEAENAVWKCRQCEQLLCVSCESELHRKGARARHERIPLNVSAFSASNMKKYESNETNSASTLAVPEPADDPRHPCDFCGRKFNPDRVQRHMRICASNQRRARKRRTWDGSEKRVIGTDFEEFMYRRAPTPPQVLEWRKNGRRWRQEREQFRELMNLPNDDEKERETGPTSAKVKSVKSTKRNPTTESANEETESSDEVAPKKSARQIAPAFSSSFTPKKATPKRDSAKKVEKTLKTTPSHRGMKSRRSHSVSGQSVSFSNRANLSSTTKSTTRARKVTKPRSSLPPWGASKAHPARRQKSADMKPTKPVRVRRSQSVMEKSTSSGKKNVAESAQPIISNPTENVDKHPAPQAKSRLNRRKEVDHRKLKPLLPRGLELGSNSSVFAERPSSMEDYRRREKIRAQQMLDAHSTLFKENRVPNESIGNLKGDTAVAVNSLRKPGPKHVGVRKRDMTRVEKRRLIQSEGKAGGTHSSKPQNREDLAAKRVSFFQSILQG